MSESSDVRLEETDSGRDHSDRRRQGQCLHRRAPVDLCRRRSTSPSTRDRAALILGSDRCLSAGFDLSVMRAGRLKPGRASCSAGLGLALKIFESPVPVVVGCTGHAIAAGTLLLFRSGSCRRRRRACENRIQRDDHRHRALFLRPRACPLSAPSLPPTTRSCKEPLYGAEAAKSGRLRRRSRHAPVTSVPRCQRRGESHWQGSTRPSYRLTKKAMRSRHGGGTAGGSRAQALRNRSGQSERSED